MSKVRDACCVKKPTKSKKVPYVEQAFGAPVGKGDSLCLDVHLWRVSDHRRKAGGRRLKLDLLGNI
jgi:hypothetical protein